MGHVDFLTEPLFSDVSDDRPPPRSSEEERSDLLAGTPDARAEFVWRISIGVDGYRRANLHVDTLIQRAGRSRRPGGLWLIGEGGTGKTFVLEGVQRKYAPIESVTSRRCPILLVRFRAKPSESEILNALLLGMGQSPSLLGKITNDELEKVVVDAMRACGVLAILFDEAHHLWVRTSKNGTLRQGGVVGDFLKRFHDASGVAYIFAGTPELAQLRESDPQMRTRWPGRVDLVAFGNDAKFKGLLQALDMALPMQEQAGLGSTLFLKPIFAACQGNFRELKHLLSEAVFIAASANAASLTREHFRQAYIDVFGKEETPFDA